MAVMSAGPRVAVKNIVVTTDFSPAAEFALDYAISVARYFGSKIHLVHALHPLTHEKPEVPLPPGSERAAEARLEAEAEKCGEIECSKWVLKGTPLEVVERILSFDRTDLVVIGTGAAKGLKRAAAASAAEHFFRHVRCPVLTVGPSARPCGPVWAPKHLLLVTDLQTSESSAARCAVFLAREHGARLALLHVAPPAPPPYPDDQEVIARPYFESRLRELLAYKPELEYPAEFLVRFGADPTTEILRVTRERETDLIVLSVHREDPWGFDFEHAAYRIVAEAPCPILITQRRF